MERPTVLLIDDEEAARELIKDMIEYEMDRLQAPPVRFVEAESGEKAYELIKAGLRPFVAVVDYSMPGGMNGVESMDRILALGIKMKVCMYSGSKEVRSEAESRGWSFHEKGVRQDQDALCWAVATMPRRKAVDAYVQVMKACGQT